MTENERRFLEGCRIAHLATADATGVPHVIPVCFAINFAAAGAMLYIAIDAKPKRQASGGLKRLANIRSNPAVAVAADRYDEDWTRLGWVMLRGEAAILESGAEHAAAQAHLRVRYPQYRAMAIETLPVIALRIARTTSWGNLGV